MSMQDPISDMLTANSQRSKCGKDADNDADVETEDGSRGGTAAARLY